MSDDVDYQPKPIHDGDGDEEDEPPKGQLPDRAESFVGHLLLKGGEGPYDPVVQFFVDIVAVHDPSREKV